MEFDKSKVYTALNAEELEVGSKAALADSISDLKWDVRDESFDILEAVNGEDRAERFVRKGGVSFALCYLVSKPQPDWDWIVYLNRKFPDNYYLTSCRSDVWESVQRDYGAKAKLYQGTEKECEDWFTARKHLANIIAQWEDGKEIQSYINDGYVHNRNGWVDVANPGWDVGMEYRVKPEPLKWTDLNVGDVVGAKGQISIVDSILSVDTDAHIHIGGFGWVDDEKLESWEKV